MRSRSWYNPGQCRLSSRFRTAKGAGYGSGRDSHTERKLITLGAAARRRSSCTLQLHLEWSGGYFLLDLGGSVARQRSESITVQTLISGRPMLHAQRVTSIPPHRVYPKICPSDQRVVAAIGEQPAMLTLGPLACRTHGCPQLRGGTPSVPFRCKRWRKDQRTPMKCFSCAAAQVDEVIVTGDTCMSPW